MSGHQNKHLVIFILVWTAISFNHYLLTFHITRMHGFLYLNGVVLAATEFCMQVIAGLLLIKLGLKKVILSSFALMIIGSYFYLAPLIDTPPYFASVIGLIKVGVTLGFACAFYGTNALFKDEIGALVFTICNIVARSFTAFAPIFAVGEGNIAMLSLLIMSIMGGIGCLFIADLSQTKSSTRK